MTEPNTQLFLDVLAQIEREPRAWNQRVWGWREASGCETSHCFAGWALALNNKVQQFEWAVVCSDGEAYLGYSDRRNDSVKGSPIAAAAMTLLGIESADAVELFSGGNTLHDLYCISADILDMDETVLREKVAAEVGSAVSS